MLSLIIYAFLPVLATSPCFHACGRLICFTSNRNNRVYHRDNCQEFGNIASSRFNFTENRNEYFDEILCSPRTYSLPEFLTCSLSSLQSSSTCFNAEVGDGLNRFYAKATPNSTKYDPFTRIFIFLICH